MHIHGISRRAPKTGPFAGGRRVDDPLRRGCRGVKVMLDQFAVHGFMFGYNLSEENH
jgi:hypothetical protein